MKKKILNKNKGITLISLVVTIIVLIILATISLRMVLGDNGIIQKAQTSSEETNKEAATEKINFKITSKQIETYGSRLEMPTLQELADEFCEDEEIEYVTLTSKVASLEKIKVGEASSIFTKLKEYPYEFEINSALQLASIDGVKIATSDTITISREELKTLIQEEVNKKISEISLNGTYETIYEGSASTKGETYNLTKSINEYKYVIVYSRLNNGTLSTSALIDKNNYNLGVNDAHSVGTSTLTSNHWLSFCFATDKTIQITWSSVDGWSGYPEIYLIKGVK